MTIMALLFAGCAAEKEGLSGFFVRVLLDRSVGLAGDRVDLRVEAIDMSTGVRLPMRPGEPNYDPELDAPGRYRFEDVAVSLLQDQEEGFVLEMQRGRLTGAAKVRISAEASGIVVATWARVLDLGAKTEVTAVLEGPGADCDQDGDGALDCTKPECCPSGAEVEDCLDSSAEASPFEREEGCETCGDGIDQDCSGDDPACPSDCPTEPVCSGSADCDDGQICSHGVCASPPMVWALVPAGDFLRGSPDDEPGRREEEGPQRAVTITRAFLMKATEVTQAEWKARGWPNPSRFAGCDDCPVEKVSWFEALAYCNALSDAEGLLACYDLDACTGTPGWDYACSSVPTLDDIHCPGYRLPTEAEWEYAYRAGSPTAFYTGEITDRGGSCNDPKAGAIGWYCGNAGGKTHPVKQKDPNAWGLYDMAGNVWEWVWDRYAPDYYESAPATDPSGPGSGPGVADLRVFRGGGFDNLDSDLRAASRHGVSPADSFLDLGFRCVKSAFSP